MKKLLNVKWERKKLVYFDNANQRIRIDRYSWAKTMMSLVLMLISKKSW